MKPSIVVSESNKKITWKQQIDESDADYELFLQFVNQKVEELSLTPRQFAINRGRSDIADSIEWWEQRKAIAIDDMSKAITAKVKIAASETMLSVIAEMQRISIDTSASLSRMRATNSTSSAAYQSASQQVIDLALAMAKTVQAYQRNVTAIQVNNHVDRNEKSIGFRDVNGDIIDS